MLHMPRAQPAPPAAPAGAPPAPRGDGSGLTSREAERRLLQYGPNQITRAKEGGLALALGRQFTHPLALLLWAAAVLAALDANPTLAVAIVAVIVINAILAFLQEVQAEKATEALQQFLPPHVHVRRDGVVSEIDAGELVPGDLQILAEGDRLSADARLTDGAVEVDMAALTGESQAVLREAGTGEAHDAPLDAPDRVFAGTLCTAGHAEAEVLATGMHTELGRVAALSQRVEPEVSPLQRQVNSAALLIAAVAVTSAVLFLVLGVTLAGLSLSFAVAAAIGLLVANVPEGLLPTITLSLAGGVRRMARRKALVKRLTAVETLGSTDVICTDKTGTLTEGRMAVTRLWAGGRELDPDEPGAADRLDAGFTALLHAALRCNDASLHTEDGNPHLVGDPSESALLAAAERVGLDVITTERERSRLRHRAYAFDPRLKRMTTLDTEPTGLMLHTKGATSELLDRCTRVRDREDVRPLEPREREEIAATADGYARQGLRVLAFAERPASAEDETADRDRAESGLVFLGLAGLRDPIRPEIHDAVRLCRAAGIRIVVITGDHGLTAEAIAREAGIVTGRATILTGTEIEALDQAALDAVLHDTRELIVSRSNPETKLHVVDALRAQGHTVAMTGDGVNDAPALRRADIGVAMGIAGTDVAREAATMVLTDDNFASIVAAVEEGRVVYDNVRKFITYIFAHAPAETLPFIVFAVSGGTIPLAITPVQILAIDLGTDTVTALALGREPAEPGIMERPPRARESGIIQRSMLIRAWLRIGMTEAALAFGGFFVVLLAAGWSPGDPTGAGHPLHHAYLQATTMTWAGIVAGQIGAAFAARTTHSSLRQIGVFANRQLLRGVAFSIAFAAAIIYLPPLQRLFATTGLTVPQLALLATFPFIVWGGDELHRARRRAREARVMRETTDAAPGVSG